MYRFVNIAKVVWQYHSPRARQMRMQSLRLLAATVIGRLR